MIGNRQKMSPCAAPCSHRITMNNRITIITIRSKYKKKHRKTGKTFLQSPISSCYSVRHSVLLSLVIHCLPNVDVDVFIFLLYFFFFFERKTSKYIFFLWYCFSIHSSGRLIFTYSFPFCFRSVLKLHRFSPLTALCTKI